MSVSSPSVNLVQQGLAVSVDNLNDDALIILFETGLYNGCPVPCFEWRTFSSFHSLFLSSFHLLLLFFVLHNTPIGVILHVELLIVFIHKRSFIFHSFLQ